MSGFKVGSDRVPVPEIRWILLHELERSNFVPRYELYVGRCELPTNRFANTESIIVNVIMKVRERTIYYGFQIPGS